MAPELKSRKRKESAATSSPVAKRLKSAVRNTKNDPIVASKHRKETKAVTTSSNGSNISRKREVQPKKIEKPSLRSSIAQDTKATQSSMDQPVESGEDGESVDDEDDRTAALLKGFESSGDEEEAENQNAPMDVVPDVPADKVLQKKLKDMSKDEERTPGVIYVGRIPHGFYEHQMRAYFSQFGDILRLRLSRNRKTGRSKHYAFIEFASAAVARIVAQTMDKYLLFGHILQVRTIPAEQVHSNLFKGANRRYRPMPRNRMEARQLREGMGREKWEKRIQAEEKRRRTKAEKMKELGYEYEAPALRSVKDVPVQMTDGETALTITEDAANEAPKLLPGAAREEDSRVPDTQTQVEAPPETVTEEAEAEKHDPVADYAPSSEQASGQSQQT